MGLALLRLCLLKDASSGEPEDACGADAARMEESKHAARVRAC